MLKYSCLGGGGGVCFFITYKRKSKPVVITQATTEGIHTVYSFNVHTQRN